MNKSLKFLALALLLFASLSISCRGFDAGETELGLRAAIPDDIEATLPDGLLDSGFDVRFIYKEVAEFARNAFKSVISGFMSVTGAVIIAAVFRILSKTIGEGGSLAPIFDFICGITVTLTVWAMLEGVWSDAFASIERLSLFINGMTPIMTALYAAGGEVMTAAVTNAWLMAMLTVMENVLRYLLYPALRTIFALTIASAAGGLELGELAKPVRTLFTLALSFIMAMLTLGLGCQNALSSGADGVSTRIIRFAAGSFVPVIGGAVSEAIRTVMGSFSYIKSAVGVVGVMVVLLIVLPVIMRMFMARIALAVSAAIARLLDCGHEADMIGECSSLTNITLAAVISMSMMFIFALTLLMKTSMA